MFYILRFTKINQSYLTKTFGLFSLFSRQIDWTLLLFPRYHFPVCRFTEWIFLAVKSDYFILFFQVWTLLFLVWTNCASNTDWARSGEQTFEGSTIFRERTFFLVKKVAQVLPKKQWNSHIEFQMRSSTAAYVKYFGNI